MGWINDKYDPTTSLMVWAILPVFIAIIFGLVYLNDRAKGGYKKERLQAVVRPPP
jgi:hypothetical protein